MYNFNLIDGEDILQIFDDEYIKQGVNEKNTTIVLTNKRILFMDYDKEDPNEILRIGRGVDYLRYKEVYYKVELANIKELIENDLYKVILKNGVEFEFENEAILNIIKDNM